MEDGGLDFPLDEEGKRPSTSINQGAFAAAVAGHAEAHKAVVDEKKWRFGYVKHVVRQTQIAAGSPKAALDIATNGLSYLHSHMEFSRGGQTMSVKEAMAKFQDQKFKSFTITGSQKSSGVGLEVDYMGRKLSRDEVKTQVEKWVKLGVIELDTGAAMCKVVDNPDWQDLSGHTFVLFGAGSAMGPFPILMALGAHVVAVDLARAPIWKRLIAIARGSPGKLTVPLREEVPANAADDVVAEKAGCDLLKETPEIRTWIAGAVADLKQVVLGAYCYLDGPLFVRVSVAMDAIIADLLEKMKIHPALAYLCTPTDCHVCTTSSSLAALDNYRKKSWWQGLLEMILGFTKMRMSKNKPFYSESQEGDANVLTVTDAIIKEQGPNYCLAKRLQHWRAVLARSNGSIVSSNIAPSTATASVVSNKSFALAFAGMHYFRPMEIFQQDTSNSVMASLLINDLRNPQSAANPDTPLKNPMQLFASTAFHGGCWRCGYKFGTIGPPSVIAYLCTTYVVKAYLILYSALQCYGWTRALIAFSTDSLSKSTWAAPGSWITPLTYFQLMEVVHAALGIVPSNPVVTAMQIASRVLAVEVLNCGVAARVSGTLPWVSMLIFAWSVTEVIRYSFYALSSAGIKLFPLTWLRYSTFLILYPIGVSGELGVFSFGYPIVAERHSGKECGLMPCGLFGKAFAAGLGGIGIWIIYLACFPMLYGTMLAQRKKVLGKRQAASKDKKA